MSDKQMNTGTNCLSVGFVLNKKPVRCDVESRTSLADLLRHGLNHTGTHVGCEHGVCGACTVMVDGKAVRSCLQLGAQVEGCQVTTVEGLAGADGTLGVLQQAFREKHALQCGFCTPGMLTTLTELLRECPDPSEEEVRDRISGNLCRCTGYQPIIDAALLAAARLRGASPQAATSLTTETSANCQPVSFVGQSVLRTEDPALLRGEGRFVDDIHLPDTLHCCFVRSPHAHARVRSIDVTVANQVAGVHAVWTHDDLPTAAQGPLPFGMPTQMLNNPRLWHILASEEVRFVGEAVAVVFASSRAIAEDAANLVAVEYEELPIAADLRTALDASAPRTHSDVPSNLITCLPFKFGDVDAAFAHASHVVKRELSHHRGTAHPMECRAVLANLDASSGELTVWNAGQGPHMERRLLADALRYDEARIRVVMPDVGGGFGPKGIPYPEEFLVACAALELRKPVKWTEDRREHFLCVTQERDQLWSIEMALDGQGKILGIRGKVLHDNGAYLPFGLVVPIIAVTSTLGPYIVPAFHVEIDVAYTNKVPTTPVRGAGRPKAAFVMERLMDAAADQLGMDRLELRRRNFVQPEQMPYSTGLIFRDNSPMVYDSGDYPGTQAKAVELARMDDFRVRQAEARRKGRHIGIGFANFVEGCGLGPYEGAEITLQNDGRISLNVGGAGSQGQGMKTIFAQIAADRLHVPVESVSVVVGDTQRLAMGIGTFASRITVNAGNAVHEAAGKLAERIRGLAAAVLQVNIDDVVLEAGCASSRANPAKSVPMGQLARMSYGTPGFTMPAWIEPGMTVTHYFTPKASTYANGSAFAEVEVDIGTGHVQVARYGVAHDCGNVINPLLVQGQVLGGILHGVGNTLLELHAFDANAQPLTTNFGEFALPTSHDMPPKIELTHLVSPSPNNPLGVKGAGEGGTIPVSAAIVSAMEDALSEWKVRFDQTPVLPEMVFQRLAEAGAYASSGSGSTSQPTSEAAR